jgi:hypothetical protein
MTISVLMMILAFALGPATSQSIERTPGTAQTNFDLPREGDCYRNGTWVNPCPPEPEPPSNPPYNEIQW